MSGTLATLSLKLVGDTRDLDRSLSHVQQQGQKTGGILSQALGTGLGFIGASVVMKGFGAAAGFAQHSIIGFNADMEQAKIAFTTLLKSGTAADKMLRDLQQFAKTTPFEFPEVRDTAVFIQAMGFAAKDVIPLLTSAGNAASALGAGAPGMQSIIRALGQMRGAARVNAQDMNQLVQVGVPAWQILAKAIGKSVAQTRDLAQQGKISSDVMLKAFDDYSKANYGGLMEKQSRTFTGALSNIKDVLTQTVASAFLPFFNVLRDAAVKLGDFLQSPGFQAFATSLGQSMAAAFTAIGKGLQFIGQFIGPVLNAFGDFTSGAVPLTDALMNMSSVFLELRETILNKVLGVFQDLVQALPKVLARLTALIPPALTAITQLIINWAVVSANQFMNFVGSAVDILQKNLPAILTAVSNFFQAAFDWIINTGVPMAAAAIGPLALKFIDWVGVTVPKLVAMLPSIAGAILEFLVKNIPVFVGKLLEWSNAFVNWIRDNVLPRLPGALANIAGSILGWVSRTLGSMIQGGVDLGKSLLNGMIDWVKKLPGQVGDWLMALVRSIPGAAIALAKAALNTGKDFVNGFISGLHDLPGKLADKIRSAFANLHIDVGPFHISGKGITIDLPNIQMPKFQHGAWDTGPRSFAGVLDPHEMIVPAKQAEHLRALLEHRGNRSGGVSPTGAAAVTGGTQIIQFNLRIDSLNGDRDSIDYINEKVGQTLRLATMRTTQRANN